ncbi:MAG: hypothetical protein GY934_13500, partial [Gammaproteobacteria bacterium]|nr:hypothetical protein [Gammaproteobacteria bacterium]
MWKPIKNTLYKVSSTGDIRTPSGKTLAPDLDRGGYKIVGLRLDGNKLNNRNSNLRWGTSKENAQDTILHGRQVCGFDHP